MYESQLQFVWEKYNPMRAKKTLKVHFHMKSKNGAQESFQVQGTSKPIVIHIEKNTTL
jgi:hypothetical protein